MKRKSLYLIVFLLVSVSIAFAAAEKVKVEFIRVDKENVFVVLKSTFPSFFGSKTWLNTVSFETDPNDTSKFIIEFEEEAP